jgi:hypothetical protein
MLESQRISEMTNTVPKQEMTESRVAAVYADDAQISVVDA